MPAYHHSYHSASHYVTYQSYTLRHNNSLLGHEDSAWYSAYRAMHFIGRWRHICAYVL